MKAGPIVRLTFTHLGDHSVQVTKNTKTLLITFCCFHPEKGINKKISDLRNFQKKSENFKPVNLPERSKNYLADVLAWLAY
jgi:hypothetical protein